MSSDVAMVLQGAETRALQGSDGKESGRLF